MRESSIKTVCSVNFLNVNLTQDHTERSNIALQVLQSPAANKREDIWRLCHTVCHSNARDRCSFSFGYFLEDRRHSLIQLTESLSFSTRILFLALLKASSALETPLSQCSVR